VLLAWFQPCFTAPSYRTFCALAPGGTALLHRCAPALDLLHGIRLDGHLGSEASRAPPWPGRA
jgi:hypothetical protein